MKNKILALVLALVATMALAAPPKTYSYKDKEDSVNDPISSPEIGAISTDEVGDRIFRQDSAKRKTTYRATVRGPLTSDMDRGYKLSVPNGVRSVQLGVRMGAKGLETLACLPAQNTGFIGLFGDRNVVGCLVDQDGDSVFEQSTFKEYIVYFPISQPVPYEAVATERTEITPGGFHFEILYQGVSKGEIKISYREFINGLARPAFNQDVAYEMNKDGPTLIGFKGVRMKVLRADNQSIEYAIEQFSKAAEPAAEVESVPDASKRPWYQGGPRTN